jgi:hypothetical protein
LHKTCPEGFREWTHGIGSRLRGGELQAIVRCGKWLVAKGRKKTRQMPLALAGGQFPARRVLCVHGVMRFGGWFRPVRRA